MIIINEELLELSLIDSFRNHPFLVQEDESLFELMDSIKKNGLINGALIGSIYIVSIYLLSSIIEKNFSLNIHSIIMIIICIITGILGGIIGVNKK